MNKWEELATGESGDIYLERDWLNMVSVVFKVFCEKQHDYGYKNIAIGGLKGVVMRSGDKMSRLFEMAGLADGSLAERDPAVKDEDMFQNLLDWADYGIIAMMVYKGLWPKCTVGDAFGREAIENIIKEAQDILGQQEQGCACQSVSCQHC